MSSMETTLEVRWFIPGTLPKSVQKWFRLKCLGDLLEEEPETREDLYTCQTPEEIAYFKAIAQNINNDAAINLKLREGKLELKLRQNVLKNQRFGNFQDATVWQGNIEQWCKFSEQELTKIGLSISNLITKNNWISVYKKREQKLEQGVKSELTQLRISSNYWWSVAFEMSIDTNEYLHYDCFQSVFKTVINCSCKTYDEPQLLTKNSYGYSRWLLNLSK